MINNIDIPSPEEKNQKLNIADIELSAVLDTDESYDMALKNIDKVRKHCLETLGVIEGNSLLYKLYNQTINHYLRNGASYFIGRNTEDSTPKELARAKKDYVLFISVIRRIDTLTDNQKKTFLENMKIHHETPQKITDKTEDSIIVMDRILSSILSK